MAYNHQDIEQKWQKYWNENKVFKTINWGEKPKKYILDMFPYPSGAGLHVGHPKGYTATDIVSRYYHATGHNVLHTMGFDAFGLPAENYAIKTGTHPSITTAENISVFTTQLQSLGFSYDWDRMVDTTDPEYYKWTQWIFLELFKRWLAYEQDLPINYCPSCKTGLANEEVTALNMCDRCGTRVERRPIRQWVLRITDYADRLLSDLDTLDWPEGIKEMQRNWIGRSEGCEFRMQKSDDTTKSISVYTTRIDTVYGMTYAVLAPDHLQVQDFITESERVTCEQYIEQARWQSDQDRTNEGKEKTGVWTGSSVINPYNGEPVPLWIADYVLGTYGTGAVMAVPDNDERDWEFAKKYKLDVKEVILAPEGRSDITRKAYTKDGLLTNSWNFNMMTSTEARRVFSEKAETEGFGSKKVNYKLRDWLFSRQRYWGEPIPLIHITHEDFDILPRITDMSEATDPSITYIYDKKGTEKRCKNCTCEEWCTKLITWGKTFSRVYDGITGKLIIDSRLPLTLPEVEKYEPAGDGQSPLATVPDWVNVKLADNLSWKRETNTMPQWGGSCWYYLRYMDSKNPDALASKETLDYWQNVDEYVGGAEHAVLHLLYARFWHKVLYDIGVVPTIEPFYKLTNVWLILGPDGNKMSKSKWNVINPNVIVAEYGADTLRLYEMSMSAFTDAAPWDSKAIIWVRRFLDKAYSTIVEGKNQTKDDMRAMKLLHKTIKKVWEDIVAYKFNTAISAMMILLNEWVPSDSEFALEWQTAFATILHPFAPHMAEELWGQLRQNESIYNAEWPEYDEWMLIDDEVTIAVQISGKLRGTLTCLNWVAQDEVSALAHADPDIAKWLIGKTLVKEIYIPNKMLSIVVRD